MTNFTDPVRVTVTDSLTDPATVRTTPRSQRGDYEISVYAVNAAGERIAADAGTAAVTIVSQSSGGVAEPLLDFEGDPVSVDMTADARTLILERASVVSATATPSDMAGADVVGIRLAVYEAE